MYTHVTAIYSLLNPHRGQEGKSPVRKRETEEEDYSQRGPVFTQKQDCESKAMPAALPGCGGLY